MCGCVCACVNPIPVLSQLLHSTVVDTAVVFPHRLGLPYKRALRNVMADHLKRIIQDNGEHDTIFSPCHSNGAGVGGGA